MVAVVGVFIFDPTYIWFVMVPTLLLALWAQAKVHGAYSRASKIPAISGFSGAEAARYILDQNGLPDVAVERVSGFLSDHYDPRHRVLRLSPDVYGGRSLAALGIAAHEAGHALQQAHHYGPLVLRNAIVPLAAIGSNFSFILILIGLLISPFVLWLGVAFFALTVVFQLVNLPVEFDASKRAKTMLEHAGLVRTGNEAGEVRSVLNAAAMTYVAATVTAVFNLAYFILLAGNRE